MDDPLTQLHDAVASGVVPFDLAVELAVRGGDAVVAARWRACNNGVAMVKLYQLGVRRGAASRPALLRAAVQCLRACAPVVVPAERGYCAMWSAVLTWAERDDGSALAAAYDDLLPSGTDWLFALRQLAHAILQYVRGEPDEGENVHRTFLLAGAGLHRTRRETAAGGPLAEMLRLYLPPPTWKELTGRG